jgi:hypothetical protein
MDINNLINGEELDASLETTLAIEQFLSENYRFRRNLLNGKVEFAVLPAGAANSDPAVSSADDNVSWRPLHSGSAQQYDPQGKEGADLQEGQPEDGNPGVCEL